MKVLRRGVATEAGDVLDAAQMKVAELSAFYQKVTNCPWPSLVY
jgi:monomeric isocitrate dehydrogenase